MTIDRGDLETMARSPLFQGIGAGAMEGLLADMDVRVETYVKDEEVFVAGQPIHRFALVLEGTVVIEQVNPHGSEAMLSSLKPPELFGEAYALMADEPLLVNARARAKTCRVALLDTAMVRGTKVRGLVSDEVARQRLMANLLTLCARKNLTLTRRSFHTAPRTIRGRLLSYLGNLAIIQGSPAVEVPFDRRGLAAYLNVDRSALCHEIGKLRREGLLTCRGNDFELR